MADFIPLDHFYTELPQETMSHRANDFYELMKKRRSVRNFSDRQGSGDIIENAIHTAGTVPKDANLQPCHFSVSDSRDIKKKIRETADEEERAFYNERALDDWLDKLAPLGTDEHKPFLKLLRISLLCLHKVTVWMQTEINRSITL